MMGCLLELVCEILFESVAELIAHVYLKLATMIVPEKTIAKQTTVKIKNIVITVSVLLIIVLVMGILFLLPPDPALNTAGRYMTFIPLGIIALQMILGVVMIILRKNRH